MDAYVKRFADYRTIKHLKVISNTLILDSLEAEASSITVAGTSIGHSCIGNWLIIDGAVYWITAVKPNNGKTQLTLASPLEAFSRPLVYAPSAASTVGAFAQSILKQEWASCPDPVYAVSYLVVSDSDTTPFVTPEVDKSGCFSLSSYLRLMRKSYRTIVRFSDSMGSLVCQISRAPAAQHQVSFDDGRSQLKSEDYAASGTAKLTVLRETGTGQVDRLVFYLSSAGEITTTPPTDRAQGEWKTLSVAANGDVAAKVAETFAKNKSNHKIEFWSLLDLEVQDGCTFFLHGELLRSYISSKKKISNDKRYLYKSGELATTATEKLRGVRT